MKKATRAVAAKKVDGTSSTQSSAHPRINDIGRWDIAHWERTNEASVPQHEGVEIRKPSTRKTPTRELLLIAGREVFAECGFEVPCVRDVARVAGVSRAAFYLHFKSLEELVKAVYARETDWQLRRYQSLTADIVRNERRMRGWIERVFASFRQERRYLRIFYRAHSIDPTLMRQVLERRRDLVLDLGRRIPELGIFSADGEVQLERLTEVIQVCDRIDQMSAYVSVDSWPDDPGIAIRLIARDFVRLATRR